MAEFDLRALVRVELETNPANDPRLLALDVAKQIEDDDLRDALEEVLPEYVRQVLITDRLRVYAQLSRDPSKWNEALRQREAVLDEDGRPVWHRMADYSRDQLLKLAAQRRKNAEANNAVASRYERVADAMKKYGASRLGDLDPVVLAEVWG